MDNITHTLIGALVGEAVAAATKPAHEGLPRNERRAVFVTAMAIGSNVPDLDVLYSTVTGSKLDYLLHHRGHTHTFAIAVVIAGLLWLACERWAKRRGLRLASADRMTIVALCLLAPVLHVLMDLTNSYGVHPFWPFDNRWLYGDAVFIVEPLLWAAAAPLLFTLRTRIARSLVALALIIGIGLTFFTGFVPLKLAVAYSVLVVALVYASSAFSTRGAIALGIAFWLLVTACYMGTSRIVAREVSELAAASFAQAQALDRVLTPMPVNPLCWEMLLVQREADDELVVRRGMFALPSRLDRGNGMSEPQSRRSDHRTCRTGALGRYAAGSLVRPDTLAAGAARRPLAGTLSGRCAHAIRPRAVAGPDARRTRGRRCALRP